MKLTDNSRPAAETGGEMVTMNMGISDNAEDQLMILNVLSSTLYTDKVVAVLREYGCNAVDANIEAGRGDVPIEVHLPTRLEPSLRIRDFGFGMTEEQIANTFVKLGRSTKRNSNEVTGMLGIGSKAGYAYGDSFMISSIANGTKVVYSAFRDKGMPKLAKLSKAATTDRDGIEIKVPVRSEHFDEFHQKAERIYRYFKVRPKILGRPVTFSEATRLLSGKRWHIVPGGKSIAIMGNVGYDLTSSGMGGWTIDSKVKALIDLGVELEFDIGDLEITASREGLQYKDVTKTSVTARLASLVKEVSDTFTKQIVGAPSLWEASKLYGDLFEKMGNVASRSLKEIVDGNVKWNGIPINTGRFSIENKERDPEVSILQVSANTSWRHSRRSRDFGPTITYASQKTVLVINDLPKKGNSPSREEGFFQDPANKDVTNLVIFTFQSDRAHKAYWKARNLTGAPTINFSTITPYVPPNAVQSGSAGSGVPRTNNPKHSAQVFSFDETSKVAPWGRNYSEYWKKETVNLDTDSGVYVVIDKFKITTGQAITYPDLHPSAFHTHVATLRKMGLLTGPVYGFKRSFCATENPDPKRWVKLSDAIPPALDKKLAKSTVLLELANFLPALNYKPQFDLSKVVDRLPKGSAAANFFGALHTLKNPGNRDLYTAIANRKELEPWIPSSYPLKLAYVTGVNFRELENKFLDAYPMLRIMKAYAHNLTTEQQNIADYIRLVESV